MNKYDQTAERNTSLGSYFINGCNENGFICIPRGLLDALKERCANAGINIEIEDKRNNQKEAITALMKYDNGIISAATAFGKTVTFYLQMVRQKMNIRKISGILLSVVGTLIVVLMLALLIRTYNTVNQNSSTAIIGGADGPTAVFLISQGGYWMIIAMIAGIAMLITGIVLLLKKKNKK